MNVRAPAGASPRWTMRHTATLADRIAHRADAFGTPLFIALSGLYWVVTLAFAHRKLMWNDEIYTYYMAHLPTMSDVWAALLARGEQTPPLFYLLTRASITLAGDTGSPEPQSRWPAIRALACACPKRWASGF
jgi:hypothetical protein